MCNLSVIKAIGFIINEKCLSEYGKYNNISFNDLPIIVKNTEKIGVCSDLTAVNNQEKQLPISQINNNSSITSKQERLKQQEFASLSTIKINDEINENLKIDETDRSIKAKKNPEEPKKSDDTNFSQSKSTAFSRRNFGTLNEESESLKDYQGDDYDSVEDDD